MISLNTQSTSAVLSVLPLDLFTQQTLLCMGMRPSLPAWAYFYGNRKKSGKARLIAGRVQRL